jgi:para-nitrobenzyl esterase
MSPIIDGRVIAMQPSEAFARGLQHKMPYIAGSNSNEQSLLQWLPGELEGFLSDLGTHRDPIMAEYRQRDTGGATDLALQQLAWRDARMAEPARMEVASMSAAGQPAFLYRFSYVPVARRDKVAGAGHGAEVPFVFGNVAGPALFGEGPADAAMAKTMSAYWVRFAKTGNPGAPGEVAWPAFSSSANSIEFASDGVFTRTAYDADRLDAFEAIRREQLRLPPGGR